MDQEVDVRVGPIVCDLLLALRNTIAGCSGPIAGPSLAALAVVHPWARVDQPEVDPDHTAAVVGDPVEDSSVPVEDSPDPGAGIAVAGEGSHQVVDLDRTNRKLHDRQAHHEMRPWLGLYVLVQYQ